LFRTKLKIEAIIEMADYEISCQKELEWYMDILIGTNPNIDKTVWLHSNEIGDSVGESFTITKVEVII
jgi:hypothetical protein